MKNDYERNESRRGFLKGGLRALLLGVIVFVSGFLGWRNIFSAEETRSCTIESPCKNCPEYRGCKDPKALEFKQEKAFRK